MYVDMAISKAAMIYLILKFMFLGFQDQWKSSTININLIYQF